MLWKLLWLSQLAATLYMTGLIWFVQLVHYPLFAQVGRAQFQSYELSHSHLTTFAVAPMMLLEAVTAGLWLCYRPPQTRAGEAIIGAMLVALIWLSTWGLQVPKHNILSAGFDPSAHQFLVVSNWLRTLAWSARSGLLLWITARLLKL